MIVNDPIADLLTRLRNALAVRKRFVLVPHSKTRLAILELLRRQGYVGEVVVAPDKTDQHQQIKVGLRYGTDGSSIVKSLRRVSKPGQRIYTPTHQLRSVLGGVGIAVVSTSQGLLTDAQARKAGIGGEVLFKVW
ncbi:MAG: 30S ribosomal protein S8 [bacterium]